MQAEELAELLLQKLPRLKEPSVTLVGDIYIRCTFTMEDAYKRSGLSEDQIAKLRRTYSSDFLDHHPTTTWEWLKPLPRETVIEWVVRNAKGILDIGGMITVVGHVAGRIPLGPSKKVRDPAGGRFTMLEILHHDPEDDMTATELTAQDLERMTATELLDIAERSQIVRVILDDGSDASELALRLLIDRTLNNAEMARLVALTPQAA